ncbi:Pheromone a factor receptor [Colletotrichum tropicale]|nr:Pheromone a factor receptor [Colletotrichum tropicale]
MAPISESLMARSLEVIPLLPTAPYTTPSMKANLICRVVSACLANLVCLIPLRNLYRNGEFAAAVFVSTVILLNLLTVVNSLIWRDDNIKEWWRGWIWCDIHPYLYQPALTIYATSIAAIMRNLAEQVNLDRAGPLTTIEKRKRMWFQALIIFPLPVIQVGWLYPLAGQRYVIGTLKGCLWSTTPNWPCIVFFLLPIPVVTLMTGFYSVLTWRRFKQIEGTTRSALVSNSSTAARSNRTRRRLFLMTTCILVPYVPISCAYAVYQIKIYLPLQAFDFKEIHYGDGAWPWDSVILYPYDQLTFFELNSNYLPIITTAAIFVFFGMSKDSMDTYRHCLLTMRLDKVFPRLSDDATSSTGQTPAGSWGTVSMSTLAKSPKYSFGRSVHVSQVLKGQGSLSSPPPPYTTEVNDPSDDMRVTVIEPESCAISEHKDYITARCISSETPKGGYHHGDSRPNNLTGSFRGRLEVHGFSDKQIPAVKSRVHAHLGSDMNHLQAEQSTQDDWLPRLSPQPELITMIQAHMEQPETYSQERRR